ncbi:MAG: hypothetical protein WDN07_00195 [Actinomycetota bacterium]
MSYIFLQLLPKTDPTVVLLLNLTRDQLHRMYEVKRVADRWHVECAEATNTVFVVDIDDHSSIIQLLMPLMLFELHLEADHIQMVLSVLDVASI